MSWRKRENKCDLFCVWGVPASLFLSFQKKKKTRHLQDDHKTHKQKGRLLFAEHIWTSLRLNIPNVTWAGNDLFTGSVVTPAKRRGGGGGDWDDGDGEAVGDESCERICWAYRVPLLLRFRCVVVWCSRRVWRCNLPFDFHSVGRMGGCRSLLPGATTSNPYPGQAGSLINTD